MSHVTVFSPLGIPLADLHTSVWRSWVLNDYGEARFSVSVKDNKARESFLRFGNMLLIEHDSLPPWVGFIDTPREWSYGRIDCKAIGAEILFDWRMTLIMPIMDSVGNVYKRIIDDCNSWGGLKINYGDIFDKGAEIGIPLGGKASDHIHRISRKLHLDWSITPRLSSNNKLELFANLFDGMAGEETRLNLSNTNSRITSPIYIEDGAIFNHVFCYSEPGEGGGRIIGEYKDDTSIAKYGLRQLAEQGVGAYEPGLRYQAYVKVTEMKDPKATFSSSVTNVNNSFKSLRLGNVFYWDTDFAGFGRNNTIGASSVLRILGMEYDDAIGACELVAQTPLRYLTRQQKINQALRFLEE